MVGNFDEEFLFGEFGKGHQIKNMDYCMCAYGTRSSDGQIYKFHQYQLRANSPNLMLTKKIKFACYAVSHTIIANPMHLLLSSLFFSNQ